MKSIVVHIGFHKSASTYLQKLIFPKAEAQFFFLTGPPGESRKYLELLQTPRNRFNPEIFKSLVGSELECRYHKQKKDVTILSHEEISGHPHGHKNIDPFKAADNLKQTYPDAKILIVIRNQFSYLTSLYTYRVSTKGEEYRDFETFLKQEGKKGLIDKMEYHKLIKHYLKLYGRKSVLILPMELLYTNIDEFNKSLSKFLKIDLIRNYETAVVNESTKIEKALYIWRIYNWIFKGFLNLLKFMNIGNHEEFPQQKIRYANYYFKKYITRLLNKGFNSQKHIDIMECSDYDFYKSRYMASNRELQPFLETNLQTLGYPI